MRGWHADELVLFAFLPLSPKAEAWGALIVVGRDRKVTGIRAAIRKEPWYTTTDDEDVPK